jgi:hypothetical protein
MFHDCPKIRLLPIDITHNKTQDDFHTSCYTKMKYNQLFFTRIFNKRFTEP